MARNTAVALAFALLSSAVAIAGCKTLEGAGQDINRGLRDTQQDVQHGIRGGPDDDDDKKPKPATSGSAPAPARPAPTAAPAAAPSGSAPVSM